MVDTVNSTYPTNFTYTFLYIHPFDKFNVIMPKGEYNVLINEAWCI